MTVLGILRRKRQRHEEAPHTYPARTYQMGGGWGNRIEWTDWDRRRIVGWKPRLPIVGDYVDGVMHSGRTARFEIIAIDYPGDPYDLFFATVKDIGYLNENGDVVDTKMETR